MANKPIKSCFLAVSGVELNSEEARLFKEHNPLGISLFARNVKDKQQLKKLVEDVKNAIGRDNALIAVDQEGGRVRRLAEPNWRSYASQMTLGKVDSIAAKCHARLIAGDLRETVINLDYAPVLDIQYERTTLALRSRCFSDDKEVVARLGRIMVDEYIKNGICPCIKHMPGIGRMKSDPHLGLPVLENPLSELQKDFYPFKMLNDAPCGMTGHFLVPWLDDRLPVTQSCKAIDTLIRGEIGFDGLLISDALDMKALQGSFGERAYASLKAGCDAVCMYSCEMKDLLDVCENAQILSDKSLIRLEKIEKLFENKMPEKNRQDISDEYDRLIGSVETYVDDYDATEVLKKMKQRE